MWVFLKIFENITQKMHLLCKMMHAALPEATAEAFNNIIFFHNQKQSLQYISLEASK